MPAANDFLLWFFIVLLVGAFCFPAAQDAWRRHRQYKRNVSEAVKWEASRSHDQGGHVRIIEK